MLEFDEIKRFSSVYAGAIALAVFVVRKLAGYAEYLFFPVVRANRAFREGHSLLCKDGDSSYKGRTSNLEERSE